MAKNSIRDYANAAASNTDVQSVNIDEGCSPAGINNAIREVMADLADVNDGTISLVSPDFNSATLGVSPDAGRSIDAFPSGTKMLFQQTAAPIGWTKDATHNDKALRVVSGTVTSGGTQAFSASFDSYSPQGTNAVTITGHPLSLSEMPSHNHVIELYDASDPSGSNLRVSATDDVGDERPGTTTESAGNGSAHTHANSTALFTGTSTNQFDVQYVDVIVATKD